MTTRKLHQTLGVATRDPQRQPWRSSHCWTRCLRSSGNSWHGACDRNKFDATTRGTKRRPCLSQGGEQERREWTFYRGRRYSTPWKEMTKKKVCQPIAYLFVTIVLTFRSCSKHAYKLWHVTNYLVSHMHHINFTVRKILQAQLASPDTTSEATGASLLHQVMHVTGYARTRTCVHCGPLLAVWKQTRCSMGKHHYILNMLVIIGLRYTFKSS